MLAHAHHRLDEEKSSASYLLELCRLARALNLQVSLTGKFNENASLLGLDQEDWD